MKKVLTLLALLMSSSAVSAQTTPAQMGITPTTTPEVLKTLDNTKTWVPIGTVNSSTHVFTPVGGGGGGSGEADIVATDPAIGMVSGGTDNLPFVNNLMSAIGPSSGGNVTGYDVLIPGVHGQLWTEYYFSNSLDLTRGANYHCSGAGTATQGSATILVFAPGVDGVIEDSGGMTADGGGAGGTLSACRIISMGYGNANANPVWNPNVLTTVSFTGDPAGIIPNPTWHVGDGLTLFSYFGGFSSPDGLFLVPIGTTVTAIDGATGNLTLSNPVNALNAVVNVDRLAGTAVFTETGSNNFSVNDTLTVGATTFRFVSPVNNSDVNIVQLGPDFATSAANLLALIMHTPGEGVAYWPDQNRGPNSQYAAYTSASFVGAMSGNTLTVSLGNGVSGMILIGQTISGAGVTGSPVITAGSGGSWTFSGAAQTVANVAMTSSGGPRIGFTSIFSGPAVNTFPTVYTPAGTAAGAFGGTHFTGAQDSSNCSSPCAGQGISARFVQLPKTQEFKIQTTAGSPDFTVISGPKLLQTGDVIWSDAFPFGATVGNNNADPGGPVHPGTAFPYSLRMADPTYAGSLNATVTHAPGAEGNLWILPAGVKRRTPMTNKDLTLERWGLGESTACSSGGGLNCDLSRDNNIWHFGDIVGRWMSGNNYATTNSTDEQFSHDFFADMWEGGTLGEVYVNPNGESPESGSSLYSYLQNCANQNYTTIFGSYTNVFNCTYGDILHPTVTNGKGPLVIGSLGGPAGNPSITQNGFEGSFIFKGGFDNQMCTQIGDELGGVAIAFSYFQCSTGTTWNLAWDPNIHAWSFNLTNHGQAMTLVGDDGWTGYNTGTSALFEGGIQLGDSADDLIAQYRLLDGGYEPPAASANRLSGDIRLNSNRVTSSILAWTNLNIQSGIFLTGPVAAGSPTLPVNGCFPNIPVGIPVAAVGNTPGGLDQVLGTFASCAGTTITLQAPSAYAANSNNLEFLQWRPAGPVANDAAGTHWTLGNYMSLNPVALASLPAGCTPGTFAVINNGVASPVYNAAVGSTTGAATDPVFCNGGSVWTYH